MVDMMNSKSAYIEITENNEAVLHVPLPATEKGAVSQSSLTAAALYLGLFRTRPGLVEELVDEFNELLPSAMPTQSELFVNAPMPKKVL